MTKTWPAPRGETPKTRPPISQTPKTRSPAGQRRFPSRGRQARPAEGQPDRRVVPVVHARGHLELDGGAPREPHRGPPPVRPAGAGRRVGRRNIGGLRD
jgi:hypothetical protein